MQVSVMAACYWCTKNAVVTRALFTQTLSLDAPNTCEMHDPVMEDQCERCWLVMTSLKSSQSSTDLVTQLCSLLGPGL